MAVQNFAGAGKGIFDLWEEGAKELEKTGIGKLITAPIRVPQKLVEATTGTLEAVPKTAKTVPLVLILLAVGVAGYLIFAGRSGTRLLP